MESWQWREQQGRGLSQCFCCSVVRIKPATSLQCGSQQLKTRRLEVCQLWEICVIHGQEQWNYPYDVFICHLFDGICVSPRVFNTAISHYSFSFLINIVQYITCWQWFGIVRIRCRISYSSKPPLPTFWLEKLLPSPACWYTHSHGFLLQSLSRKHNKDDIIWVIFQTL